MKVCIFAATVLISGCSTLIDEPNPQIICRSSSQVCPASSEALEAVWAFKNKFSPEFSIDEPLQINWYDRGDIPRPDGSKVVGQALSRYEVDTISWAALFHELVHVDLWRRFDDPDANHEQPPGPWQADFEERIRAIYTEAGFGET